MWPVLKTEHSCRIVEPQRNGHPTETWRTTRLGEQVREEQRSYIGFKGRCRKRLRLRRRILFSKHMDLENIEVMQTHRTKINQEPSNASAPQPRPIHVCRYLPRYLDKGQMFKAERTPWMITPFAPGRYSYPMTCKNVLEVQEPNDEETTLGLKQLKETEGVQFAFILWSVSVQILYKETDSEGLKYFKIRHKYSLVLLS